MLDVLYHSILAFMLANSRCCRIVYLTIAPHCELLNACLCSSDRFVCTYFYCLEFWIAVTCHLMNWCQVWNARNIATGTLWSRNRQNSCVFNLPSYLLKTALQYQKSCLLFANFKKQRRKANANSVRRPHCSHLLCA